MDPQLHPRGVRAKGRPGARDDVLFEHDAAIIVGTETKRDLTHVRALRDPRSADMIDVVQEDAAQGLLPEIEMRPGVSLLDARPFFVLKVLT